MVEMKFLFFKHRPNQIGIFSAGKIWCFKPSPWGAFAASQRGMSGPQLFELRGPKALAESISFRFGGEDRCAGVVMLADVGRMPWELFFRNPQMVKLD